MDPASSSTAAGQLTEDGDDNVIRNVTLIEFKPDTPVEHLDAITEAMHKVRSPGLRSLTMGRDLGLRKGNLQYAVVADFDDEQGYRAFVEDPEHQRIAREMTMPAYIRYQRVQFEISATDSVRALPG
jgi:hypothetical protein